MKKLIKKIPKNSLLLVLCVAMGCFMIFVINLRINAESIGGGFGQSVGSLAGKALGSLEGMTTGRTQGTEAGKQLGLSAEDTEADISTRIRQVENLEVLVASVKLNDVHSIGADMEYAALYLMKGDVIFSVDLSKAAIMMQNGEMHITIPQPKGELVIDQSQVEKVAEYQKHFFTGQAEAGFDAYLNSMAKVYEASAETLDNYNVLIEAAKESAIKQVTQLAQSTSTLTDDVHIHFMEEEDDAE